MDRWVVYSGIRCIETEDTSTHLGKSLRATVHLHLQSLTVERLGRVYRRFLSPWILLLPDDMLALIMSFFPLAPVAHGYRERVEFVRCCKRFQQIMRMPGSLVSAELFLRWTPVPSCDKLRTVNRLYIHGLADVCMKDLSELLLRCREMSNLTDLSCPVHHDLFSKGLGGVGAQLRRLCITEATARIRLFDPLVEESEEDPPPYRGPFDGVWFPKLESLDISGVLVPDYYTILSIRGLPNTLTRLELCLPDRMEMESIEIPPNLQTLIVSSSSIGLLSLPQLLTFFARGACRVRELVLNGVEAQSLFEPQLPHESTDQAFWEVFPELRSLTVKSRSTSCHLTPLGAQCVPVLRPLSANRLQSRVFQVKTTVRGGEWVPTGIILASLQSVHSFRLSLRELQIYILCVHDRDVDILKELAECVELRRLSVYLADSSPSHRHSIRNLSRGICFVLQSRRLHNLIVHSQCPRTWIGPSMYHSEHKLCTSPSMYYPDQNLRWAARGSATTLTMGGCECLDDQSRNCLFDPDHSLMIGRNCLFNSDHSIMICGQDIESFLAEGGDGETPWVTPGSPVLPD